MTYQNSLPLPEEYSPPDPLPVYFEAGTGAHHQGTAHDARDIVAAYVNFRPSLETGQHSMTYCFLEGGELGQIFTLWKQPELLAGLSFCENTPEARWTLQGEYARKLGVHLHPVPDHMAPWTLPNVQRLLALLKGSLRFAEGDFAVGGGVDIPQIVLYGTPLELSVWRALMEIPAGQTRCYAQIAEAIGRPKAVRAVASAIGRNPVSVFVPCHRVLRKDGTLGGYAGGLNRKKILLHREGVDFKEV